MKPPLIRLVPITLLLAACAGIPAGAPGSSTAASSSTPPPTVFTAAVTSPFSVQLGWPSAAGAQKYVLDVKVKEGEFSSAVDVSADQTGYEAFPLLPETEYTFRLRAQTASGVSEGETVTLLTPAVTPNPLSVQAVFYEPVTWVPPTIDPLQPITDPSLLYPPGFDPEDPENFDPSALMAPVVASAEIGPDGGSLSITTPDKITYTLTVPPGALESATLIVLTPVQSIDNLPFSGGLRGAVSIEPDGLYFDPPATLSIERADSAPLPAGMAEWGFTFDPSGADFQLNPISTGGNSEAAKPGSMPALHRIPRPPSAGPLADLAIAQARVYGAAAGTPQEARKVVQNHPPSRPNDSIWNALVYGPGGDPELAPLGTGAQLAGDRLVSQAKDAASWNDVMGVLDNLEFYKTFFGKDAVGKAYIDKILDPIIDRLEKMLQANKEKCFTAEDVAAQSVVSRMLNGKPGSFGALMGDRFKKKFGDALLKEIAKVTKTCTLELQIRSEITVVIPETADYTVTVEGTIPLKYTFRGGRTLLYGNGEITYQPFRIQHSQVECTPLDPTNKIRAAAIINRLEPVFHPTGGALLDFNLKKMSVYDIGRPKFILTCTDPKGKKTTIKPSLAYGVGSLWHGNFVAAHIPELEITGWKLIPEKTERDRFGNSILARKLYDRPAFTPQGGFGTWTENSEFLLVRTNP